MQTALGEITYQSLALRCVKNAKNNTAQSVHVGLYIAYIIHNYVIDIFKGVQGYA